jgi:hypothetical protein
MSYPVRRAIHTAIALKRMSMSVQAHQSELAQQVTQYKADAENVCFILLIYSSASSHLV